MDCERQHVLLDTLLVFSLFYILSLARGIMALPSVLVTHYK